METNKQFTEEELLAKKAEMLEFYKESMPYLEAQLAYEKILADIDEQRFKRTNIQYQLAMMHMAQQEEVMETPEEESSGKTKKLKTN
jgi:threonyl-tRNA synthetase